MSVRRLLEAIERRHVYAFETTLGGRTVPKHIEDAARAGMAVHGCTVHEVTAELGPPHDRTFEVVAMVDGTEVGRGSGRSKKHAEQEAARRALEGLDADDGEG